MDCPKQLATMFDSWTALANNPELDTSKTLVLGGKQQYVCRYHQPNGQTNDAVAKRYAGYHRKIRAGLQWKVKQLQSLNEQIYGLTTVVKRNDLLDRRDSLLKDLSGLAGIETRTDQYGRGFCIHERTDDFKC